MPSKTSKIITESTPAQDRCKAKCKTLKATGKNSYATTEQLTNQRLNCETTCKTPQTASQKATCVKKSTEINKIQYANLTKRLKTAIEKELHKVQKNKKSLELLKTKLNPDAYTREMQKYESKIKDLNRRLEKFNNKNSKNDKNTNEMIARNVENLCNPKDINFEGYLGDSKSEEIEWYKHLKTKKTKDACAIM